MATLPSASDGNNEECTAHSNQFIVMEPLQILSDLQQILIETALMWVHSSARGPAIFITSSLVTHLDNRIRQQYSEILRRLVFIYAPTFKSALERLTELHDWKNMPALVIVESLDLILEDEEDTDPFDFYEAAIDDSEVEFDYNDIVEQRFSLFMACLNDTTSTLTEKLKSTCHSVVTISEDLCKPSVQNYQYKLAGTINTPHDILPCLNENA